MGRFFALVVSTVVGALVGKYGYGEPYVGGIIGLCVGICLCFGITELVELAVDILGDVIS